MSQKKTATGEFLDPRAFGELLDLNRESVYRAISRGELQAVRVGRAIRLPRAQLERSWPMMTSRKFSRRIERGTGDEHGF